MSTFALPYTENNNRISRLKLKCDGIHLYRLPFFRRSKKFSPHVVTLRSGRNPFDLFPFYDLHGTPQLCNALYFIRIPDMSLSM